MVPKEKLIKNYFLFVVKVKRYIVYEEDRLSQLKITGMKYEY